MKKTLTFLVILFALPLAYADEWPVCIDTQEPGSVTGLSYSGNIVLIWNEAEDLPECSGIDHYEIYRNGDRVGITSGTTFSEGSLENGDYAYDVFAVDKGDNMGEGATIDVSIGSSGDDGGGGGGSSGGGGGSPSGDTNDESDTEIPPSEGEGEIESQSDAEISVGVDENSGEGILEEEQGFLSKLLGAVTGATVGAGSMGTGSIIAMVVVALAVIGIIALSVTKKMAKRKGV